jgi:hypothetical protein
MYTLANVGKCFGLEGYACFGPSLPLLPGPDLVLPNLAEALSSDHIPQSHRHSILSDPVYPFGKLSLFLSYEVTLVV